MSARKTIKNQIKTILDDNSITIGINQITTNQSLEIESLPISIVNTKKERVKKILSLAPSRLYLVGLETEIDLIYIDQDNDFLDLTIDKILEFQISDYWNDLKFKNLKIKNEIRGNQNLAFAKASFEIDYLLQTDFSELDDLKFTEITYKISEISEPMQDYFKYRAGRYLLQENGLYLLLENGKKIVI